jgi:hypothetical protein
MLLNHRFSLGQQCETHKYIVWQNSGLLSITTYGTYTYHSDLKDYTP